MKRIFQLNLRVVILLVTLLCLLGGGFCYAADSSVTVKPAVIIPNTVIFSENTYFITVRLGEFHEQSGRLYIQCFDRANEVTFVEYYPLSAEIKLEFPYSEDLDFAVITWLKDDSTLFCEPVTLKFNKIYAADWQSLATATHRMDFLYGGKVQIEDNSREYASGRLIVKTKEELPDVSAFHVAMIIADDEDHYFLQFETSNDTKECAEYLKQQPGIDYVDIDSVVTVSK